ncbi:MAG: NifU family protein [Bacteroidia bacterium]
MAQPVNVYAESTPNPAALKFVSSRMLLSEGSVEYASALEASICPLAQGMFSFSSVKSVFISSNFITVTKEGELDWYEISNILREYIRGFLMSDEKVFLSNPFPSAETAPLRSQEIASEEQPDHDDALISKIVAMLEEYVSPAVAQDGGEIRFRSFKDGVVTVALRGSCSGCPSSSLTLKSGIENLLKNMIPEVKEVVAEADANP